MQNTISNLFVKKSILASLLVGILAILMFTFLRKGLILIYPILLILITVVFRIVYKQLSQLSILLVLIITLYSFVFHGGYLSNIIISLFIFYLPIITLLSPATKHLVSLEKFMRISFKVLAVINITGFINFIINLYTHTSLIDDGFVGVYGNSGLMMHTLALINFIYCVYYFYEKKIYKSAFLFLSGFMCFYGLGLIIFIIVIAFLLLTKIRFEKLKYILISILLLGIVFSITEKFNPKIFLYIKANINSTVDGFYNYSYKEQIKIARENKRTEVPRKITAFAGGLKRMTDLEIFSFGAGPGSYNSRTSFLLNGEYSKLNNSPKNKGNRPVYAELDVYPLWNRNITYQYNDGTRNQPFSSVLALIVEYGFLQFILISLLIFKLIVRIKNNSEPHGFFKFLIIFLIINLFTENYIEYPEFFILVILLVKIIETSKNKSLNSIEK